MTSSGRHIDLFSVRGAPAPRPGADTEEREAATHYNGSNDTVRCYSGEVGLRHGVPHGAAINTRTGRVTFLPFATCCLGEAPEGTEDMIAFRADSTLLVLNSIRDERRADVGADLYRIEGDRLVHLRDVPFPPRH